MKTHPPIPCRLQHVKSGRIVSAPSINAFCHKIHMSDVQGGWINTIGRVLDGRALQFRGWFNPKVNNRTTVRAWLKQPYRKGLKRRCHLQHIDTGKVIDVKSIRSFCRKAKLKGNAGLHITPVLNGKRRSYKGWYLPEVLNQEVAMSDVYGNTYRPIKVRNLISDHEMSVNALNRILKGRLVSRGLTLAANPVVGRLKPRDWRVAEYAFKVTDARKGGCEVYRGSNLSKLADEMRCYVGSLYPLLYGWRESHRIGRYRYVSVRDVVKEAKVADPKLKVESTAAIL